jgi:hypothetical protein
MSLEIEYQKILLTFLTITNQIKLYHWRTLSHPRHVASGNLYSQLDELVDKFIEALQGRCVLNNYNNNFRILLNDDMNTIVLKQYKDDNAIELIKYIKKYLECNELFNIIGNYSDLVNLKDEMLTEINKSGYLFSLK